MTVDAGLPMVGRDAAVAALDECVRRAGGGTGALVLVSGEAGIGKTTLCEHMVDPATATGRRSSWASCWQAATMPALWPWSQLLGQLVDGGDAMLRPSASAGQDAAAARLAQFDAVARGLADLSDEQVLVLIIDDLHWGDPASVSLVAHLATVLRSTRVVLVATYRPEDVDADSALGQLLGHLRRYGQEVRLAPLDEVAVSALLAARYDGAVVEPATVAELTRLTGGNPLVLVELVRVVELGALAEVENLPLVPPRVRDLVGDRLAALRPECRRLLDVAALIGDEVAVPVLAEVASLPARTAMAVLDEAVAAGTVRWRAPGRFEFAHPLFRAAVYEGLSTARRVSLHADAGHALERLRGQGHSVDPGALAHHFGQSAPLGTAASAVRYGLEAGEQAMNLLAYESAVRRFRGALAALELDPSAGDRTAILLALGTAQAACGAGADARTSFAAAVDAARAAGRVRDLARAALGVSGGVGIEVPIDDHQQMALLDEAIGALGETEPGLRSWLTARLSVASTMRAPLTHRAALAQDALALAKQSGEPDTLAYALAAHCDVIAGPDDVAVRGEQAHRVVALAAAHGNVGLELLGRRLVIEALLEQGRFEEAALAVAGYARSANAVRDPRYDFYVPLWRGALALARGDRDGYWRHRDELRPLVRAAATENASTLDAVQDLFAAIDLGETERGRAVFEGLMGDIAVFEPMIAITAALVRALTGQFEAARELLESVAPGIAALERDSEWLPAVVQIADIAAVVPDTPLVDWAYQALLPHGRLWSVEGIGAGVRGPVERALGLLAARRNDTVAARGHFDRAIAACRSRGARLWEERTARDAERMLHRPPPAPSADAPRSGRLVHEGAVWLVEYGDVATRVRDSKGMRDLAVLLARPGESFAALDLMGAGKPVLVAGAAGPGLDDRARAAYRQRLRELEEDLDGADAAGDATRSATLAAERDALAAELSGAYGLGGRARQTGSSAERARTAVTTRVRDTIRRLDATHPDLARHLRRAVRTGTFCGYHPDPAVVWEVATARI